MNRQRSWIPAVGLTILLAVLAGCGQPGKWQIQTLDTASEGTAGAILVTDASFVYDTPVEHGAVYQPGETMPLQATIVNRGTTDDKLLSVRSPIATEVEVRGITTMRAGQSLVAGYTDPIASIAVGNATRIDIELKGLRKPVRSGPTYPVVFTFAEGGKLRLEVAVQNPDTAREECPLPPEGKPHRTLVAPPSAPKPKGPPVPGCSSLTDEPEVQVLDSRAPLTHLVWAPKHLALLGLADSVRGKRLVRVDPLTGDVERSRELVGAGENFDVTSEPVERIALPLTDAGRVALLDVETLEEKRSIAVGDRPSSIAVHSPSKSLFVLSEDGSTVTGVDYESGEQLFRERVDAGRMATVERANKQEEAAFWLVAPDGFTYYSGKEAQRGPTVRTPVEESTFGPGEQNTPTAYHLAKDPRRVVRSTETPAGDLKTAASNAVQAPVTHVAVRSENNRVYAVTAEKVFTMRADTLELLAVTDYRTTLEKASEPSLADATVADVAANADHVFLALDGEPHIVEVKTTKK